MPAMAMLGEQPFLPGISNQTVIISVISAAVLYAIYYVSMPSNVQYKD